MKKMELENMFFDFSFVKTEGNFFELSRHSTIKTELGGFAREYLKKVISELTEGGVVANIRLITGIPDEVKALSEDSFSDDPESYALVVSDEISIYSASERGLIYGVSTLKQLTAGNALKKMVLFDSPDKKYGDTEFIFPANTV